MVKLQNASQEKRAKIDYSEEDKENRPVFEDAFEDEFQNVENLCKALDCIEKEALSCKDSLEQAGCKVVLKDNVRRYDNKSIDEEQKIPIIPRRSRQEKLREEERIPEMT